MVLEEVDCERMVCRLCPGWEKELAPGQRGGARAREGGWAPWGGILAPCLGVLAPFPEAGGSEDKGVHLGGTDLGVMRTLGARVGWGWDLGVSLAACKGNQRTSRIGWGPQHRIRACTTMFQEEEGGGTGTSTPQPTGQKPRLPGGWSAGSGRSWA